MQPMFLLTRAFAISALLVGAAPLSSAAPLYTTQPCATGESCSPTSFSSIWGFLSAMVPKFSQATDNLSRMTTGPLHANSVELHIATTASEHDDASVVLVFEEHDSEAAFTKREDVSDHKANPEPAEDDVDIIIREPEQLAGRDAEPDPAPDDEDLDPRMCFMVAMCKRDDNAAQQ